MFLQKKLLLVYAIVLAIAVNILQLPHIMQSASSSWRSIENSVTSNVIETALENEDDPLAKTHNLYMVLGEKLPHSTMYVNENLDAESVSKIYGLGEVSNIRKRNIDAELLFQEVHNLKPSYSGTTWTSPKHIRLDPQGINWKIYVNKNNSNEFMFIKKTDSDEWLIIDKAVLDKKELERVCNDC